MTNDVTDITPWSNRSVEQILELVRKEPPDTLLCLGFTDGELYIRSGRMTRQDALWLIEQAKEYVLRGKE